jgi:hypothetical protein
MKKILTIIFLISIATASMAAIPTEEGLLKNLNNPNPNGKILTIKMAIKNQFYKMIFLMDRPGSTGLMQIAYGDSQMQSSQIKDIKFIADLPSSLAKETTIEKSLFYGTMLMLATNHSVGLEIFLEKNGVKIIKNKSLMNEEKMILLRNYRSYLSSNKGKGESDSPLNPATPEEKAKVIALFKSNTYTPSKNIELVKIDNVFYWKADWKNLQGFFTNEERRLKKFYYKNQEGEYSLEASNYTSFNGLNELPKFLEIKNSKGLAEKIQIISEEVSSKRDPEDFSKKTLPAGETREILSFLY